MRFFTPDLLDRFGSEDDAIALAAQEELERRSEDYARHLRDIGPSLPPRLREMLERYYLHDASVVAPLHPTAAGDSWPASPDGQTPAFWIALQLDPPPREFLVLHYREVTVEAANCPQAGPGPCPPLEWLHDEVELEQTPPGLMVRHSILFTNNVEVRLRFRDFDFATLKPFEALPGAGREAQLAS